MYTCIYAVANITIDPRSLVNTLPTYEVRIVLARIWPVVECTALHKGQDVAIQASTESNRQC